MSDLINRDSAITAMLKEQEDDLEAYGCAIPEGFDGDRAVRVLKQLPTIKVEPFTDGEKRIFLSAMRREEKICKEFDDKIFSCDAVSLVRVCHEITRKVKGALWTGRRLEDGKE